MRAPKGTRKSCQQKHYTLLVENLSEPDHLVDICFLGFDPIEVACARQDSVNMDQRWCLFIKLKTPVSLEMALRLFLSHEEFLNTVPKIQACKDDFKTLVAYRCHANDWFHSFLPAYAVSDSDDGAEEVDLFCDEQMSGEELIVPVLVTPKDALQVLKTSAVPMTVAEVASKLGGTNKKLTLKFLYELERDSTAMRSLYSLQRWESV